jgi:hypothetical protein
MCYASQQVIRKEFDYNAYIAGRLRGEYVVIYHTITDGPATVSPEDSSGEELICVQENDDIPDSPINMSPSSVTDITECRAGIMRPSLNTDSVHFYSGSKSPNTFTKATFANCRGAP